MNVVASLGLLLMAMAVVIYALAAAFEHRLPDTRISDEIIVRAMAVCGFTGIVLFGLGVAMYRGTT